MAVVVLYFLLFLLSSLYHLPLLTLLLFLLFSFLLRFSRVMSVCLSIIFYYYYYYYYYHHHHYYYYYYWGLRAHSYDLFRVAEFRKRQEVRAIETQGEHYYEARKLRHRLMQYMDSDEDFWDLMTPAVAQKMYKDITQLERISANLPAGGPASEKDGRSSQPFEVIFKQSAQSGRKSDGKVLNEDGEVLSKALDDPDTVETLQELIIRGL